MKRIVVKKGLMYPIAGAAAALPIIFPQIGLFGWLAFIPLALLCLSGTGCEEGKGRFFRCYRRGFSFFFAYFLVSFSWLLYLYPLSVTGMDKGAALFVVLFAWIGIPVLQSTGFALVLPIFDMARRRGLPRGVLPIFMGALWSIGEWVQNFFWFGVPWVRIALSQTEMPVLFSSASLLGSYFVGFLIIAVNFYIALAVKSVKGRERAVFSGIAAIIFALNFVFGVMNVRLMKNAEYKTVTVSALQGNLDSDDKWGSTFEGTVEIYDRLCSTAKEEGAEYALLPETAFPYNAEKNSGVDLAIAALASKYEMTLFVGTFGDGGEDVLNVIRVYAPNASGETVYVKRRPVPFGEYIPMRDLILAVIPALGEINMLERSILPGDESSVWQDGESGFGYLICFDSIYAEYARESVLSGAEALMISTNDSWFGDSVGIRMHNAAARLRAAENARSVVRSANTGISSVITPWGEESDMIPYDTEGQITKEIAMNDSLTLYSRIGDLFVYICLAASALMLAYKKRG